MTQTAAELSKVALAMRKTVAVLLAVRVEKVLARHELEPEWRTAYDISAGSLRRCICGSEWINGCRSETVRLLNGEDV